MQFVKKSRRKAYGFLPLQALQILNPRQVIGLFYHVVASQPLPHVQHLYQHRPVELFEQDLLYIKEHFQLVDAGWLVKSISGRSAPKDSQKTPLHLSFDDGFVECFTVVRPLLLEHQVPCTFFITTDFIDNQVMYYRNQASLCISQVLAKSLNWFSLKSEVLNHEFGINLVSRDDFVRWIKSLNEEKKVSQVCYILQVDVTDYLRNNQPYLSRNQIRTLASEGFTIGAHSRRHQKLGRLTPSEMADEIVGSCQAIAEITGQSSVPFSFPNSGDGVDRHFLADLRRNCPEVGLIFNTKGLQKDESYIINRIWVESRWLNPDGLRPLPEILRRAYLSA